MDANSHNPTPAAETGFDVTLDVRTLRARVVVNDGVPSLALTDGAATVQINTGIEGPVVRDLIPLGRFVASALRFQTHCNRFTRARAQAERPANGSADDQHPNADREHHAPGD
jgi:hypothetical protein